VVAVLYRFKQFYFFWVSILHGKMVRVDWRWASIDGLRYIRGGSTDRSLQGREADPWPGVCFSIYSTGKGRYRTYTSCTLPLEALKQVRVAARKVGSWVPLYFYSRSTVLKTNFNNAWDMVMSSSLFLFPPKISNVSTDIFFKHFYLGLPWVECGTHEVNLFHPDLHS